MGFSSLMILIRHPRGLGIHITQRPVTIVCEVLCWNDQDMPKQEGSVCNSRNFHVWAFVRPTEEVKTGSLETKLDTSWIRHFTTGLCLHTEKDNGLLNWSDHPNLSVSTSRTTHSESSNISLCFKPRGTGGNQSSVASDSFSVARFTKVVLIVVYD